MFVLLLQWVEDTETCWAPMIWTSITWGTKFGIILWPALTEKSSHGPAMSAGQWASLTLSLSQCLIVSSDDFLRCVSPKGADSVRWSTSASRSHRCGEIRKRSSSSLPHRSRTHTLLLSDLNRVFLRLLMIYTLPGQKYFTTAVFPVIRGSDTHFSSWSLSRRAAEPETLLCFVVSPLDYSVDSSWHRVDTLMQHHNISLHQELH